MTTLELEARLDNLLSTAQEETKYIDIFAPIPEKEECPICMIPLPITRNEILFMSCCGKDICNGCVHKHIMTEMKKNKQTEYKCAFCCQPPQKSDIKALKRLMKKNNPHAFMAMAEKYVSGDDGVIQSETRSLEMRIRAAELGHTRAYLLIGEYYLEGNAVEHDYSKALVFWEIAAKKGEIHAHVQLIEHMKVAASAGDQDSMDDLMTKYKEKFLSKDDITQTLRAFQASSNAIKSKDRDEAKAFFKEYPLS